MNCPDCHIPMKQMNLPSEGRYGASKKHTLWVCQKCGREQEIIGGDKCR